MIYIKNEILRILSPIWSKDYFISDNEAYRFPRLLPGLLILLFCCTVILFFSALVGPTEDLLSQESVLFNPRPIERLYFPVIWLTYAVVFSGIRHLFLRVIGTKLEFWSNLSVSLYGIVPLVIAGTITNFINNILPFSFHQLDLLLWIRITFYLVLIAGAFFLEWLIFKRGTQAKISVKAVRLLTAWMAPWITSFFIIVSVYIVLILYLAYLTR